MTILLLAFCVLTLGDFMNQDVLKLDFNKDLAPITQRSLLRSCQICFPTLLLLEEFCKKYFPDLIVLISDLNLKHAQRKLVDSKYSSLAFFLQKEFPQHFK